LLSTFYSEIAVLIDDKFKLTRKLKLQNENSQSAGEMFNTNVLTFVQSIFGVYNDDYCENYGDIDPYVKEYIEQSCKGTYGGHMTKKVNNSESVLVSILIMEARLQTDLLFILKAVMKHMA